MVDRSIEAPPSGEATANDQRLRLIGAMIEAASARGYSKVTIGELVGIAGISKSAFYDHFPSKDACFLATVDEIVRLAVEETGEAFRSRRDVLEGLEMAIEAVIDNAVAYTAAAHLVVVDSIELGRGSLEARERIATMLEAMIRAVLNADPASRPVSALTIRAIVGGIRGVLYHYLLDRRPERMRPHVSGLAAWELCYVRADGEREMALAEASIAAAWAERERQSSVGRAERPDWDEPPRTEASRAALGQRERIIRGAGRVAAARGYQSLTVPAISTEAGTSNQTFYQHFLHKEAAFLAAVDALVERALAGSSGALSPREDRRAWGAASLLALLETLATDELLGRVLFFEVPTVGPAALSRATRSLLPFTAFLRPAQSAPQARHQPPRVVAAALTAGIWSVVERELIEGRRERLPELAPQLLAFALTPFGLAAQ
jgi:AcrR family transcriptional regulator